MQYVMAASRFLAAAISVYTLLIWVRVILTWVRIPEPYFQTSPLLRFLSAIVDPYLAMFRGITWMRRGAIDFTPVMALMVLSILQSIFSLFGAYGTITLPMVAGLCIQAVWGYIVSPLFWFVLILLGIRLFFCYYRSASSLMMIQALDRLARFPLDFTQKLFFGHRPVGMRLLVWTAFIFFLILYFALRTGVAWLTGYLVRL